MTREMLLKHAIELDKWLPPANTPRYRCKECALSWTGKREDHPADETCEVSVALDALRADPAELHALRCRDIARRVWAFVCSCDAEFDSLEAFDAHYQEFHNSEEHRESDHY